MSRVAGSVRYVKVDRQGNSGVVAGPFKASVLDDVNQTFNPEDYLYLNTMHSARVNPPLQAREESARGARIQPGEQIVLEHQSQSGSGNTIDYDSDSVSIGGYEMDLNTGRVYPRPLTVADQELEADVTSDSDTWTKWFQFTAENRTQWRVLGQQGLSPEAP